MTTAAESRQRKSKKCQNAECRAEFVPQRMGQKACSPTCAVSLVQAGRAKAERKEIREAKQKAKTRGQWVKETQAEFNRWIRCRDAGKPCISCGSMPEQRYGGTMDCGHYRSTGSAPGLRFTPENAASQCVKCNRYLGGNSVQFRAGLIARIGLAAVEALEDDQAPRKYSIEELKAMKAEYARKRRELETAK